MFWTLQAVITECSGSSGTQWIEINAWRYWWKGLDKSSFIWISVSTMISAGWSWRTNFCSFQISSKDFVLYSQRMKSHHAIW